MEKDLIDILWNEVRFLHCPACWWDLDTTKKIVCKKCKKNYNVEWNIPQFFIPNDYVEGKFDVTKDMKSFYEETPFPNYNDSETVAAFMDKAKKWVFARLLDEQIPFNSRIIECGCWTGQLSNFLSLSNRKVIWADMCMNSLKLANEFKENNNLKNVKFMQMNLFRPTFKPESFDYVISNWVLHHTSDPYGAFQSISKLVRPWGHIIIGLYHKYGRIFNDVRRVIFKYWWKQFQFLDHHLRDKSVDTIKKDSWFNDQYLNPHESKHTISEVIKWYEDNGFDFVKSIPKSRMFQNFSINEQLFSPDDPWTPFERFLVESAMVATNHKEWWFFIVIWKKRK